MGRIELNTIVLLIAIIFVSSIFLFIVSQRIKEPSGKITGLVSKEPEPNGREVPVRENETETGQVNETGGSSGSILPEGKQKEFLSTVGGAIGAPAFAGESAPTVSDVRICQNAQDADLCGGVDLAYGEGYKEMCCSEHNLCC